MSGPKTCESCGKPFEPWKDEYGDPEDICKWCSHIEEELYLEGQLFDREFGDS